MIQFAFVGVDDDRYGGMDIVERGRLGAVMELVVEDAIGGVKERSTNNGESRGCPFDSNSYNTFE